MKIQSLDDEEISKISSKYYEEQPKGTPLAAHGLELGAHRKSPNTYVSSREKMPRACNFCPVHVGSPKTGLLDSPDDLLAV